MNGTINLLRLGSMTLTRPLLACLFILLGSVGASANITVSTTALQVVFNTSNGSFTVTDLSNSDAWTQEVPTGTQAFTVVSSQKISGKRFLATVQAPNLKQYSIDLKVDDAPAKAFHVTLTPDSPATTDPYPYIKLPPYPFFFQGTNTTDSWYYVQNNGGEGTLMGIDDSAVRGRGGWTGSQPWWGVTNLTKAMMARLDSFAQIENPTAVGDPSAYKIPLEIEYCFYSTGGYVGLAKAYRNYFLPTTSLVKLADRVTSSPDLAYLKDGTYAYLWDYEANMDTVSDEMKTAGLDRVIGMFSLHEDQSRLNMGMLDYLATSGSRWLGGLYRTPTPNLFSITSYPDWVNNLLLRNVDEATLLASYDLGQWDELDTDYSEPKWATGASAPPGSSGLPYLGTYYGTNLKVIYHDTLPQQLGPSIYGPGGTRTPPYYVQSIEDNRTGRQKILDDTRLYTDSGHPAGFLAGSGEGVSAWWTVPHLDYWEGGMEESIYGDIDRHPNTEYGYEFASDTFVPPGTDRNPRTWKDQEADCLQEGVRIPLLALQWHNYVAETWNWRDSTFVVSSLSWKKDLFNILYCGMPMWHITKDLWEAHTAEYTDSYFKLLPVRQANGFAEMTDHQFVTTDHEVQYTDWDSGKRVIVNFRDDPTPYLYTATGYGSANVPSHGYAMLPDPVSENCEGTGTPAGWTNSGATPNWDYTVVHPEGAQSLYLPATGTSGSSTQIDFANQSEVWVYFKLRLTNTSQGLKTVGGVAVNGGSTISQLFQVNTVGLKPSFGGLATTDGFLANTTYDVFLHYRKGTGSNGIIDIGFSTDGTKPTSGTKFAKSTTYNGTNDAGRLFLGTSVHTNFDIIVDKVRVDNSEIGGNPP